MDVQGSDIGLELCVQGAADPASVRIAGISRVYEPGHVFVDLT